MLLTWASAFPAIRVAVRDYPPGELALLRFFIASCVLSIPVAMMRAPLPRRDEWPLIMAGGMGGVALYNYFLNLAEKTVAVGLASFLTSTAPIFAVLLSILLLGERVTWRVWLGIGLSVLGVALMSFSAPGAVHIGPEVLMLLGTAVCAASFSIVQKKLLHLRAAADAPHISASARALRTTTHILWMGTVFLMVFAPGVPHAVAQAPLSTTLAILYLGIVPSCFGNAMWTWLLTRIPVSVAVNLLYLIPLMAGLLAWLWLGEKMTPGAIAGGVLILVGVAIVNLAKKS